MNAGVPTTSSSTVTEVDFGDYMLDVTEFTCCVLSNRSRRATAAGPQLRRQQRWLQFSGLHSSTSADPAGELSSARERVACTTAASTAITDWFT
jgi:hypothetical protein